MHISMDALTVFFRIERHTKTELTRRYTRDLCFKHAVVWAMRGEDVTAVTTEEKYPVCNECAGCSDWDGKQEEEK